MKQIQLPSSKAAFLTSFQSYTNENKYYCAISFKKIVMKIFSSLSSSTEHLGHLLRRGNWQLKTQYYLPSLNTLNTWLLAIYLLLKDEARSRCRAFLHQLELFDIFAHNEEEFDDLEIWSARKLLMQKLISIKQEECTSPISNCKMHLPHFWNVST